MEVLGCSVCQLILTLYANDLIEFLKKKHAPGTYKSFWIWKYIRRPSSWRSEYPRLRNLSNAAEKGRFDGKLIIPSNSDVKDDVSDEKDPFL